MSSSNQLPNHLDPFLQGHEDEIEDDEKEEDDETYHVEDIPRSPSNWLCMENMQPFRTASNFGGKLLVELIQESFELIGIKAKPKQAAMATLIPFKRQSSTKTTLSKGTTSLPWQRATKGQTMMCHTI